MLSQTVVKAVLGTTANVTGGHPHLDCIPAVSVTAKTSLDTLSVLKDHRRQSELRLEEITMGPACHRYGETWANFGGSFDKAALEVTSRRMVAGENADIGPCLKELQMVRIQHYCTWENVVDG